VVRGVIALSAVVAAILGIAAPSASSAALPCWQQLVRDWGDGRIDGVYSVSCYRRALARLPEDLQVYSSAPDDIQAALQHRVHETGHARRALAASAGSRHSSDGWSDALPIVGMAGGLGLALAAVLGLTWGRARRQGR